MNKYMEELTQMLQTGLEEYATSEKYRDLLRVMSLFHNYSANNCLLIALQCPHASYVAGYTSWRNNFHRQVKEGRKSNTHHFPCEIQEEKRRGRRRRAYWFQIRICL